MGVYSGARRTLCASNKGNLMSTAAQITANTINARSSTGARTEAGHAASSKNATVQSQPDCPCLSAPDDPRQTDASGHGLFAQRDFIRPGEEADYATAKADLTEALAPSGPLEFNLVDEIHRATWRLGRCGQVEASFLPMLTGPDLIPDPMQADATAKLQLSVDRARSQSHRLLHKCTAELRKLQTERQFRNEHFVAGTDISDLGISSYQSIRKDIDKQAVTEARLELSKLRATFDIRCPPPETPVLPMPSQESGSFCKTEKMPPATPRNAPCPCNSGEKYKRCCGKNAPPMLQAA
jgi:hypothetical protein